MSVADGTTLRSPPSPWFRPNIECHAQAVGNVLRQCYADPAAVTDELVDCILKPGLQPGAAEVFLDFISYSGGPLPEQQLQVLGAQQELGSLGRWERCLLFCHLHPVILTSSAYGSHCAGRQGAGFHDLGRGGPLAVLPSPFSHHLSSLPTHRTSRCPSP